MVKIIFTQDCYCIGKKYKSGQELKKYKKEDLLTIWRLNEKGIITPISKKDMEELNNNFKNKKNEVK